MRVSVIGGGTPGPEPLETAERLGEELGRRGYTIVCGGLAGVMEAACRGAKSVGGRTVGILPGSDPSAANEYVDVPIATGLGDARNVLVVMNGSAVVAIDGSYGTLSEIAHALNADRPVLGLETHDVTGVVHVDSPQDAAVRIDALIDTV